MGFQYFCKIEKLCELIKVHFILLCDLHILYYTKILVSKHLNFCYKKKEENTKTNSHPVMSVNKDAYLVMIIQSLILLHCCETHNNND